MCAAFRLNFLNSISRSECDEMRPVLGFRRLSAASSGCVNDNITNMSQVAFGEMEYHLFHRGLAH